MKLIDFLKKNLRKLFKKKEQKPKKRIDIDFFKEFEKICGKKKTKYEETHDFARELSKVSGVEIDSIMHSGKLSTIYHGYYNGKEVAVKVDFGMNTPGHSVLVEHVCLKLLKHPNLVELVEGGFGISPVKGNYGYLIEEFIKGENLGEILEKEKLPVEKAIKYFKPIWQFLNYAFDHGKLLLDIKPENVMIDENDQVKFVDFATVKDIGYVNRKVVTGTIGFISLDAMHTQRLDPLADVYSAGLLFYCMLTNKIPFENEVHICLNKPRSEGEELYAKLACMHSLAPRPSIRKYAPEVPEELERICHKMMAVSKRNRYLFMEQLLWDLEKIYSKI